MKVWVIWARNGEAYEGETKGIWAICGSREAAEQCIANADEQVHHDEERWDELTSITNSFTCLTSETEKEMYEIGFRLGLCADDGLPIFSIREYDVMS